MYNSLYFKHILHLLKLAAVERRTVKANDAELEKTYTQITSLQNKAQAQTVSLKRALDFDKDTRTAVKRLRTTEGKICELESGLKSLQNRSSGQVPVPPSISKMISTHLPNTSSITSKPSTSVIEGSDTCSVTPVLSLEPPFAPHPKYSPTQYLQDHNTAPYFPQTCSAPMVCYSQCFLSLAPSNFIYVGRTVTSPSLFNC